MSHYKIGPFQLLIDQRVLATSGLSIHLGGRAFDILATLVAARGMIVSKADLTRSAWAGLSVGETNLFVQISAVRRALAPHGDWIVTVPGRGYMFAGPAEVTLPPNGAGAAPPPTRRMVVAVTPFENLDADPGQGFFADGFAEEVIHGLSRVGWLFVIARNSSFVFRGGTTGAGEIGRQLGARYLVGGSVRRTAGGIRVHCRLTDVDQNCEIWVDRFDMPRSDVLEMLDEVVARLVDRIENRLVRAEAQRSRSLPVEQLDAFDHVLRARDRLSRRGQSDYLEALADLDLALAIDPTYPPAVVLRSWCRQVQAIQQWREVSRDEPRRLLLECERAVRSSPDDPLVLSYAAQGISYWGEDRDEALALTRRATEISPSFSFGRYLEGWMTLQCDDPERALSSFKEAIALSPLDDFSNASACTASSLSLLHLDRREEALVWAQRAIRLAPDYAYTRRVHIAALAHANRLREARDAMRKFLRKNPGFTIAFYQSLSPLTRSNIQRPIIDGLRAAGCG